VIVAGRIYRVRTTLADPPKEKIVLCLDNLFLWFNTEPRQRPAQMKVARGEAPGITRDCHLDCGRVTMFPARELATAIDCGMCSNKFLLRVIEEVEQRATTLTGLHRRQIVQILRAIVDRKA
jgi:hypothetical protein